MKRFMLWSMIMMIMVTFIITEPPGDAVAKENRYNYFRSLVIPSGVGDTDSVMDLTGWQIEKLSIYHFGGGASQDVDFTFYWTVSDTTDTTHVKIEGTAVSYYTLEMTGPMMDSVRVARQANTASSGIFVWWNKTR